MLYFPPLTTNYWCFKDSRSYKEAGYVQDFGEKYGNPGVEMDAKLFKYSILMALKSLYGDCGYAIPVDVLKYRAENRRAFLRVPTKDLVRVHSALTLFSRYEGHDCVFYVNKVTPFLAQLSINSRTWEHKQS